MWEKQRYDTKQSNLNHYSKRSPLQDVLLSISESWKIKKLNCMIEY